MIRYGIVSSEMPTGEPPQAGMASAGAAPSKTRGTATPEMTTICGSGAPIRCGAQPPSNWLAPAGIQESTWSINFVVNASWAARSCDAEYPACEQAGMTIPGITAIVVSDRFTITSA
jgi:hypothetical protein